MPLAIIRSTMLAVILLFCIASCKKDEVKPSKINSSILPIRKGNYWQYNFYQRLSASDYSTTPIEARMSIGDDTKMPDGRDAVTLTITSAGNSYVYYLVNDGSDLVFYQLSGPYVTEELRLREPLTTGRIWETDPLSMKVDSTTITGQENITVPAGSFNNVYKLEQRTKIPYNSSFFTRMLGNDYWIKEGVGIVKQDLLSWTYLYPVTPLPFHGRYELVSYKAKK